MIQWLAFNLHTGDNLASLPGLLVDYPIAQTIGQYESATAHLVVDDGAPANWVAATNPGAALLACYDDDDPEMSIQWAGFVVTRTRNAETSMLDLSLVTAEGYLDRRFVAADLTYSQVGQNLIAKKLINQFVVDQDGGADGLPITVTYAPGSDDGTAIDQVYRDADNGTVYEALQALSALDHGPEWTITWTWRADLSGLQATFIVGDRIGKAQTNNSPGATFEMPGCLISAVLTEDYASDKGANYVLAYSSTQGIEPGTATGTEQIDRPQFEYRFQPQLRANTTARLASFATKAVNNMVDGGRAMALIADRATAPVFGRDWNLGDDVGYVVGGVDVDGNDIVPLFPGGLSEVQRVIGVQMSLDQVIPVMYDPPVTQ